MVYRLSRELWAYDATPLGGRHALILVHGIKVQLRHGINPPTAKLYDWADFLRFATADSSFQQRYKAFLFTYDSACSVSENGKRLKSVLGNETCIPAETRLVIAALSLGGLIVRKALEDENIWRRTDRFLAVSVPFHGSPLANPHWIWARLEDDPPWSISHIATDVSYRAARWLYPNLDADFCWDNFDGSIPDAIDKRQAFRATAYAPDMDDAKYIIYGGFFGINAQERHWLLQHLGAKTPVGQGVEKNPGPLDRHFGLKIARRCIADLPLTPDVEPRYVVGGQIPSMMIFNDGIAPISSQLWFGRYVQATPGKSIALEQQWQILSELRCNSNIRLFDGLDHRDWLAGQTRFEGRDHVSDQLHTHEASRTIAEWLTHDLLRPFE